MQCGWTFKIMKDYINRDFVSIKKTNMEQSKFKESKHFKYSTGNKISQFLVNGFYRSIHKELKEVNFNSLIDLGCGEGMLLHSLTDIIQKKHCCAIDFNEDEVKDATINLPFCNVKQASIYNVPFESEIFDLVICTEVLEHLETPELALEEIYRLSNKYILVSVPREPIWRLLNICRFSYIKSFGNTPGHLNHWSTSSFKRFISKKFKIISVSKPLPWTIILAEKRM